MTIHTILRMGDPRLLRVARPVPQANTPDLHALITDLF
ncbi:MAG: peptide deformylase, partial [Thiomonas sp.]